LARVPFGPVNGLEERRMFVKQTRYTQVALTDLAVEKLVDGSMAVLDYRTMSVHSLNASASVAWEACTQGASLAEVRRALETQGGRPVGEEIALSALAQLQQVKLITTDSAVPSLGAGHHPGVIDSARRSALLRLAAAAGIAVPLVLTLTASEQRAFALR
jgi:hypothetical protein